MTQGRLTLSQNRGVLTASRDLLYLLPLWTDALVLVHSLPLATGDRLVLDARVLGSIFAGE